MSPLVYGTDLEAWLPVYTILSTALWTLSVIQSHFLSWPFFIDLIPCDDIDAFQLNLCSASFPPIFSSFLLSLSKTQIIATQFQIFLDILPFKVVNNIVQ